jgi:uncharacterized membrane protein
MKKFLQESALLILTSLPYFYLAAIWKDLPDTVPTHFGLDGTADDWSSKTSLLFIPGAIGIGIYLLMLILPALDPKGKLRNMGDKYYSIRFVMTLFMSLISAYTLYLSNEGSLKDPNVLIGLLGGLFAVLGNYFPAMRPNYFVGIRTPWTLENEEVWKKTHRLAGKLWVAGGILIILAAFFIKSNTALEIIFGSVVTVIVLIPLVYSYTEFKAEVRRQGSDQ